MPLITHLAPDGKQLTIAIHGQFNFTINPDFREACKLATAPGTAYTIDLRGAEYMDSSALGMLLLLRERAGGDAADIAITNCPPEIRKIFGIANFDRLFRIS